MRAGDQDPLHCALRSRRRSRARPRRLAALPEVVEDDRVLVGVHAVPKALVAVGAQLSVRGEALERLALQDALRVEVVERARLKAEEAAVDPVL